VATPRFQLAGRRICTLREALLVTAAAAVLPGIAQLRTGRRRTGAALLAAYLAILALGILVLTGFPVALPRPERQALITLGPIAVAAAWTTLLLSSYLAVRPPHMAVPVRMAAGTAVAVLCALAATAPLTLARHAHRHPAAANGGLPRHGPALPTRAGVPPAGPGARAPRRNGARRLNLLLVGGNTAAGHTGLRTPVTLASVDTRTGDTVLLSLPGNLRHLPVPGLPQGEPLESVYDYGLAHPRLAGAHARNPGAELLKKTVGQVIGMPVDYYRVVGMRGFRRMFDAVHGERVCSGEPLLVPAEKVRTGAAGRGSAANTDVPRRLPAPLVALSAKAGTARVRGFRLSSPRIDPRRPDYGYLRAAAAQAVGIPGAPGRAALHLQKLHVSGRMCR
jgi:hypothetical protein